MARTHTPPLSPHLQVYRLPLTAVLSIMHRLTGLVLILGAVLLTAVLFALASGAEAFAVAQGLLQTWPGLLFLLLFLFALYFHFCNGIRHLFWDAGLGFDKSVANQSGIWVLVFTGVASVVTWVLALGVI